ncbi:MAG: hypothetical protein CVU99_06690 [Firmicutes bacterium HGW-Firmicutes-4]|jgi:hypothetical protein|nr:MAG: hypothetical protein CVU99_06690 [Firmicutes bacterium HGW-Firmicutes-4]
MKKLLCIILLITVIMSFTGCSIPYVDNLFGTTKDANAEEQITPPGEKTIVVVLDISGSTDVAFATSVRQALSQKVATDLVPPKPNKEDGVAAIDKYRIYVQLIGSPNSTVYTEALKSNLLFEIPAVPGLARRPDVPEEGATDDYIERYSEWKKSGELWSQKYDESLNQTSVVSQQILQIDLIPKNDGDISGVESAVITALNATTSPNLSLIIFSDLLENGQTAQLVTPTGKKGKAILVTPAPDGDLVSAKERTEKFTSQLVSWGFDNVEVFNAQTVTESINRIFE